MNKYQIKGVLGSFLIHSVVFFTGYFIFKNSVVVAGKPLLIDFNIEKINFSQNNKIPSPPTPKLVSKSEKIPKPSPPSPNCPPTPINPAPPPPVDELQLSPNEEEEIISNTLSQDNSEITETFSDPGINAIENGNLIGELKSGELKSGELKSGELKSGELKIRYFKEQFAYIKEQIMKNIRYPLLAKRMGWEGEVIVSFIICEDGGYREIKVVKGSGFEILDKNAIETIKRTAPFPKPPVKAEIILPIVYRLED